MSASTTQLTALAHCWASAWGASTPDAWLALYAPDATYIDHAFQIRRSGATILRRHWNIWRKAMPDFAMEVERVDIPAEQTAELRRVSVRTINSGTFEEDLPSKKASGKPYVFRGVVDMEVDVQGLIVRLEEWYTWDFGEGRDVKDYHSLPA